MMDSDKDLSSGNPVSVLQGDKLFLNRIVSRESSVGCSSRFYYRIAEGVPFKWEMQPGKSKNPPTARNEVVPPIRAPPAVLSLGLPKPPCIDDQQQQRHNKGGSSSTTSTAGSRGSRVWFWKKSKTNQLRKKLADSFKKHSNGFERPENSGFIYNFDVDDSMDSSSPRSSSSSSFSSSNSNNNIDHSLPSSSRIHSPDGDFIYVPFGCIPWNISAIMLSVAKGV